MQLARKMQKLSTVFWLFICVKLQCKSKKKKWEKKNRETTASFVLIFGLKKQVCNFKKKKICEKKAYCFLIFSMFEKPVWNPRRTKNFVKTQQSFVLIFRYDWKTSEKVVKMRKFRLLFVFGVVLQLTPTSGRTTLFLFCILY